MQKPSQEVSVQRTAQGNTHKPVSASRVPASRRSASAKPAGKQDLANRRAVREPRFITVRKQRTDRKPFPLGMLLILGLITALFLFMMMNFAELDQYNSEIRDLNNELAELKTEQKKLETRLEGRDDLNAYKTFAEEQLGMVADEGEKRYVKLNPEDKTEIMQYDDEEGGNGYLLSGLAEVLRGFFSKDTPS